MEQGITGKKAILSVSESERASGTLESEHASADGDSPGSSLL
jgi:hypothetical protein